MSKELTREQAESMLFKVDSEGLAYAAQNGYLDDLKGTEYESVLNDFREANDRLEEVMFVLEDKFEIEL